MPNRLICYLVGLSLIALCRCILLRTKPAQNQDVGAMLSYTPDPETAMNATEIIRYHGYPAEEYQISTEDGYLIYIQRIPHGIKNTTLQESGPDQWSSCSMVHNNTSITLNVTPCRPMSSLRNYRLLCSSTNWITNLPDESLGFILADAGYDVWLGNMRGNFYGLNHKTLPVQSKEFWDFSFDEMAEYDIPSIINKALEISNQTQVSYIGHSQGTLVGFAKFSSDPEFAKKIKVFVAMGPVAFVDNMKSPPLRLLAPFSRELAFLFRVFGYRDFLPDYDLIKYLGRTFCTVQPVPVKICENILFLIGGYDYAQMNATRLDVYIAHNPAGTSSQNIFHFAQLVHSGKCQKFDFGSEKENLKHYGSKQPPEYPVADLKVPTALIYSDNDWLATPKDVLRLREELNGEVDLYRVPYPKWNHLDFIWGIDANMYVYPEVLRVLKEHNKMIGYVV